MAEAAASAPPDANIEVRPAAPADAAAVARLLTTLGYPCDPRDAAERIRAVQADPRQQLLLACVDGEGAGLLGLDVLYYLPLGAPTCRITALVVAPDAQRNGIGRRLVREAERRARLAGASRLELTSAAHRAEAHAFYRALGFTEGALRFVKALGA
ncbi:MAG TPA: GNAT family N-acetyltransferase [Lysobacter sp.]|nr:GNAT family N-acetyltransferase [Lysobacter sp.]